MSVISDTMTGNKIIEIIMVLLFLVFAFLFLFNVFPTATQNSYTDTINFTVNNTYNTTAYNPIVNVARVYNSTLGITQYASTTTGVKIYSGGGEGLKLGVFNVDYTISQGNLFLGGISYAWFYAIIFIIIAIVVILWILDAF
jgi:hypothetical protein